MSAVALAPARARKGRSARTAEMTPEQELQFLIEEQQRDDTYYVDRPSHIISLDAPAPDGEGTLGDLIGYDPETGELIILFPLPATPPLANAHQHGSLYAYTRLGCRCVPCRGANSQNVAEWRRRKRGES